MSHPRDASRPLGFGLVGTGMIAAFHAQALADVNGARLVGVAAREAAKARAFASTHGAAFATESVEELAARPEVDVVVITTPSGAHLEPALAAIRAGKHVLIEKPLEITLERADELLRAADAAGVTVAAVFQARYGEGARAVKAAREAGRFGRLVLASAYVKWHRAATYYTGWKGTLKLDGGGALINQGIHAVDLLQWFAGLPAEVFGWTTRRAHLGIEAEDTVTAALRYADGALGTIEATTATFPGWERRIELCGTEGSVVLEDDRITRWEFRRAEPGDASRVAQSDALGSGSSAPNQISHEGHRREIQDLVDALRSGAAFPLNGREGRRALALVRAIYASAAQGRPVCLDPADTRR